MARFIQPTPEQEKDWLKWVSERPTKVRKIAERFEPWSLYRLQGRERVTIYSFCEDGTVTVVVSKEWNLVTFERRVFDINPNDLVPCELPSNDEVVGALLTPDEVEDNIDMLRVYVRPDLWQLNNKGKAIRKKGK